MFQRALVCTDFSDGVFRLAQFIPSLAIGGFKQLVFFHNLPIAEDREIPREDPEAIQAVRDRFAALLREVPSDVEVNVEVLFGRPSDNILRLAKAYESDVIILGGQTRTLLEEKLFGSTTVKVSEKTHIPLLVLRPQLISTYTTKELDLRCRHLLQYLLIPYDGTRGADYLLSRIKAQVEANPSSVLERCRLLWVLDENVRQELLGDQPLETAKQRLQEVQADLASLNLVVNTDVIKGDPLQEILAAAERHDIGAIATCSRGIGGFMKWTAPSLTREILRRSWHPILYFPSEHR